MEPPNCFDHESASHDRCSTSHGELASTDTKQMENRRLLLVVNRHCHSLVIDCHRSVETMIREVGRRDLTCSHRIDGPDAETNLIDFLRPKSGCILGMIGCFQSSCNQSAAVYCEACHCRECEGQTNDEAAHQSSVPRIVHVIHLSDIGRPLRSTRPSWNESKRRAGRGLVNQHDTRRSRSRYVRPAMS